jgi:hypothetical protein
MKSNRIRILVDTREQRPFFEVAPYLSTGEYITTEFRKLDAGDYSAEGLEGILAIERKASTGELYGNLAKSTMKERFYRELDKLEQVEKAIILCEFPEENNYTFPANSGIPKSKQKYIRGGSGFFRKLINEITDKYDIEFVYCANKVEAEQYAAQLIRDTWVKHHEKG